MKQEATVYELIKPLSKKKKIQRKEEVWHHFQPQNPHETD